MLPPILTVVSRLAQAGAAGRSGRTTRAAVASRHGGAGSAGSEPARPAAANAMQSSRACRRQRHAEQQAAITAWYSTVPTAATPARPAAPLQMAELQLTVVQGKAKHAVACPADATIAVLKQRVQEKCGVSPACQKLIFKGKERKDAESLAAAGVASGDKLMLMLSAEGIKELKKEEERLAGEKRKQEAYDAQRLLEEHRAGVGSGGDENPQKGADTKATVIEEDGAREPGAQVVQVIHAKVKYRIVADLASSSATFLDLKERLAKVGGRA